MITELALPPVVDSYDDGACTMSLNPARTGCIHQTTNLLGGGFTPDGTGVWAGMDFAGAPKSPDPASIYDGTHLVLIKADGTTFPNGDAWKCISCGVPEENGSLGDGDHLEYPQAFRDGVRVLAGNYIFDCDGLEFSSEECTPEKVHIYPIYWQVSTNDAEAGGDIRELRVHPDDVHLGWSSFTSTGGQLAYVGRLNFNKAPTAGIPLVPRYDLSHVNMLVSPGHDSAITIDGSEMKVREDAIGIGELRGFDGTGSEMTYFGYPRESCNMDVFAIHLQTGSIRRLTSHPEYVDPVDISADGQWTVVMDTRGSDRQMWMAGMRHVPPIIDLIATAAASSTRNNGQRRFFQPYIIDRYGDRGSYFGQKLNGETGVPGSGAVNDPEWNGRADPKWSLQGDRIVYSEAITQSPDCGGLNPLPCYPSTADGGRDRRLMMAHLVDREPYETGPMDPIPDSIPWATPYEPGSAPPVQYLIPEGNYTLYGKFDGFAEVQIVHNNDKTGIMTVGVSYNDYSDDSLSFLAGSEEITMVEVPEGLPYLRWHSNITQYGQTNATKLTSSDGFNLTVDVFNNIFQANGSLTTTVNGQVFTQPENRT